MHCMYFMYKILVYIQCTSCFSFGTAGGWLNVGMLLYRTSLKISWALPCSQQTISSYIECPGKLIKKIHISSFEGSYILI